MYLLGNLIIQEKHMFYHLFNVYEPNPLMAKENQNKN